MRFYERAPTALLVLLFLSPSLIGRRSETANASMPTLRESLAATFSHFPGVWTGSKRRALLTHLEDVFREHLQGTTGTNYGALSRTFLSECERARFAPDLMLAVIDVESGFDSSIRSPQGAVGLMQLRPITVRHMGGESRDLTNPELNVRYGIRYLKRLRSQGEIKSLFDLFASYLIGPEKYGRLRLQADYEPRETLSYFRRIQAKQVEWKQRL